MAVTAPDGTPGQAPTLEELGWTPRRERDFAVHAAAGLIPGRVVSEARGGARALTAAGPIEASLSRSTSEYSVSMETAGTPACLSWVAAVASCQPL